MGERGCRCKGGDQGALSGVSTAEGGGRTRGGPGACCGGPAAGRTTRGFRKTSASSFLEPAKVTWPGERDFEDMIGLQRLRWGDGPGSALRARGNPREALTAEAEARGEAEDSSLQTGGRRRRVAAAADAAGFEDGGRGREPRSADGLQKPDEPRRQTLPRSPRRNRQGP